MNSANSRVCDLLIVDDDVGQYRLFEISLQDLGFDHRCHRAADAKTALAFLHRRAPFETAPRPHLIVLDINMPGVNGCDLLCKIKSDPAIATIPVIMLSSSVRSETVRECYSQHANAYLTKPADYETAVDLVASIEKFWLQYAVACL